MLLFTGNIQVWMRERNIATATWAWRAMKIRKNKRNWRENECDEHRGIEHKLKDSFKFYHDAKWRKSVRYIHSTCYVACEYVYMHSLRMGFQTTNMHYDFLCSRFSAQLSQFVMEAFWTFATFNGMRKRATFHFHTIQKLHTYIPNSFGLAWFDLIRLGSVLGLW